MFPKQKAKHQLEGRSLSGNQDYSRQNFCSPEGRNQATAKSTDCEKTCHTHTQRPHPNRHGNTNHKGKLHYKTPMKTHITRFFARGYNRKTLTRKTQIQAELTRAELRAPTTRCGSNVVLCSPVRGNVFGNQFASQL